MTMMFVPKPLVPMVIAGEFFSPEELYLAVKHIQKNRFEESLKSLPDALKCCGYSRDRIREVMKMVKTDIEKRFAVTGGGGDEPT